jgi:hypothetical protein
VPAVLFVILLVIVFAPEVSEIENGLWKYVVLSVVGSWFLFVVYYVLAKLVNSTYIHVTPEYISVIHRPLPFAKNLQINTGNIASIIQEQKRYNGRTRRRYYAINAVMPNEKKVTLVSDIDIEAQAAAIKIEIERFLGLRNKMTNQQTG